MHSDYKVLVIRGSMCAGKTTVLGEATDLLSAAGIPHAAIDLDTLGIVRLPSGTSTDLAIRNLERVWRN